ncbi:MAG: molybdopterin molybdotransferase MoeA [Gemmatimonadaceae bacterium]|nr:molybdopterin molybdotransferase MoeA [Gemmatimonadaceae bacterium]
MTARGLSYDEALEAVLAMVQEQRTPVAHVPLERALGCALAEDIRSRIALPPWDNSGMDGYAVLRSDVLGASEQTPRTLPVIGTSLAGADPTALPWVQKGTAVRIMTGAPMPPGADAVIRVEDTDGGSEQVMVRGDRDAQGRGNIRPRGEDIQVGALVFSAGTTLRAAHLGVLASIGTATVPVHQLPRVTIVSSGDELVLLDRFDEVESGQRIVSSSHYSLPALLRAAGADVRVAPLVPDTLQDLSTALTQALDDGCDLLVTTGGVSVGAHDYARDALEAIGGTQHFWRARIRPGGPIGTGMVRNTPWIGLPGNPVSTLVTATLFAWPLLRSLGGHDMVHAMRVPVRLTQDVETAAPLTYFVRVVVEPNASGQLEATPAGAQGSNLLRIMALANALLVVPESCNRAGTGDVCEAILLPDAPPLTSRAMSVASPAPQS